MLTCECCDRPVDPSDGSTTCPMHAYVIHTEPEPASQPYTGTIL